MPSYIPAWLVATAFARAVRRGPPPPQPAAARRRALPGVALAALAIPVWLFLRAEPAPEDWRDRDVAASARSGTGGCGAS